MLYRRFLPSTILLLFTVLACSFFSKPSNTETPVQASQPAVYKLEDALTLAVQTIQAATQSAFAAPTIATSNSVSMQQSLPSMGDQFIIAGEHHVALGETLSCIGRGYGVMPKAIADANGIELTAELHVGQILKIPKVQWTNISTGPICPPQFLPPYYVVTATLPGGQPQPTPKPKDKNSQSEGANQPSSGDAANPAPQDNGQLPIVQMPPDWIPIVPHVPPPPVPSEVP